MESHHIKRRGKRGGKKRHPAFDSLPSGRAPVGVVDAIPCSRVFVALRSPEFRTEQESGSPKSWYRRVAFQTIPAHNSQSESTPRNMLGAQARAAELQAMRAAAQRQKSHENEDPPKPIPVSLTDFVRPLQNKNKGLKTYKPLNLADLDAYEEFDTDSVDRRDEVSTPTPQHGPGSSVVRTTSTDSPDCLVSSQTSPLRLAPTAPKAMLTKSTRPHSSLPPKPSATIVEQVRSSQRQNTSGMFRRALLPHPFMPNPLARPYLQVPNVGPPALFPNPLAQQSSNNRFLFGLEEYSPCKPEVKHAHAHEAVDHEAAWLIPHHVSVAPEAMDFNQQMYHDQHHLTTPQPLLPYGEPYPYHQSTMLQYPPDTSHAGLVNAGYFPDYNQMDRAHTFVNDLMNHETEIQRSSNLLNVVTQQVDQPYDRSSKMQHFVAAQQAMARTGRTVLNNSSLHKSALIREISSPMSMSEMYLQDSPSLASPSTMLKKPADLELQSSDDWPVNHNTNPPRWAAPCSKPFYVLEKPSEFPVREVTPRNIVRRKVDEFPAIIRAIARRDEPAYIRSMPEHDLEDSYKAFDWVANSGSYTRVAFPVDADVGSESWCELRPPTCADREKTKRVLRTIATDMNTRDSTDMMGNRTAVVGNDARKWLHDATDYQDERRKTIDKIIEEHKAGRTLKGPGFGIIGGPVKSSENIEAKIASVRAFANIMATVEQYAEEGRRPDGCRTFVPVPEYAMERKMMDGSTTRSVFEDHGAINLSATTDDTVGTPHTRPGNDEENMKSCFSLKLW